MGTLNTLFVHDVQNNVRIPYMLVLLNVCEWVGILLSLSVWSVRLCVCFCVRMCLFIYR